MSSETALSSGKRRVLLIGWDAADWEMIDPMIARNEMPALAALIRGGVRGNLATLQPVLSPMLWTSIATGKRADLHGICGFTEPLADGTGIGPVRSTSRKCKAVWNLFSQCGLRANVIGWFASNPAEPINGVMLSDNFLRTELEASRAATELRPGTIYPPEMAQEAAEWVVRPEDLQPTDLLPFIPRLAEIDLQTDGRVLKLARRLARAASVQAAATALIATKPWDLMCVYFDAIDQFGHEFMPYHPPCMPDVPQRDFELYKDVMSGCYRFHDMMLHALLQLVDAQTTVILVSDHGYESGMRRPALTQAEADPELCHRPFGIACLRGPNIKKGERLYGASILDVTPTILAVAGLPLGSDMDGRPWLEAFAEPVRPERIFSWEGLDDDKAGLHSAAERQDPADAAAAVRQLVELGYVAAPGEDAQTNIRDTIRCNKVQLARALIGTPRVRRAIPLLEELLAEKPGDEWCSLTLARIQIGLGQLDKAKALLASYETSPTVPADACIYLAELAFVQKDPRAARRWLDEALQRGKDRPVICNQAGRGYLRLQLWEEAAAVFQQSLNAEADNPAALDGLAQVRLHDSRFPEAVDYALQAVGFMHFFPEAHFHLAQALEGCGKVPESVAAYETALGFGFERAQIHHKLAELLSESEPERAARHQRAAKSKKPKVYKADIKSGWSAVPAESPGDPKPQ